MTLGGSELGKVPVICATVMLASMTSTHPLISESKKDDSTLKRRRIDPAPAT
jgi:hypothetical protein